MTQFQASEFFTKNAEKSVPLLLVLSVNFNNWIGNFFIKKIKISTFLTDLIKSHLLDSREPRNHLPTPSKSAKATSWVIIVIYSLVVKTLAAPFWWFEDDISTLLKTTRRYYIVVVVVVDVHRDFYYIPAVVVVVVLVVVVLLPPPSEKQINVRKQFSAHQQFSARFRY